MQIRIHIDGSPAPTGSRDEVERQLRLAIGPHASRIARALVGIPKSGDWCRIHAHLARGGVVTVEGHADAAIGAVAAAGSRLAQRLRAAAETAPRAPRLGVA